VDVARAEVVDFLVAENGPAMMVPNDGGERSEQGGDPVGLPMKPQTTGTKINQQIMVE
jgi:hypothetical protein